MQLDFYYWNNQCPFNEKSINLLKKYESEFKINYFDISNNPELAEINKIYSPNLLIIDNKYRLHGPVLKNLLENLKNNILPASRLYAVNQSNNLIKGDLCDIDLNSIKETCELCSASTDKNSCNSKSAWVSEILNKYNLSHLGKLHFFNGKCIGGAEYVPSTECPYPIEKSDKTAFITCTYATSEEGDFKSYPLNTLEDDLKKYGFEYVSVIASENTPFPNGPIEFFIDRGYIDKGILIYEEMHMAKLHYLIKKL